MREFLLLLAQSAADNSTSLSGGEIGGIIGGIVTVLSTVGLGVRWLITSMIARVDKMQTDFQTQLTAKDARIDELSKALSKKSDETANTIERLQNQTIAKAEGWAEKNAELMERYVEQQAEVAAILRSLEVKMQGPGR